MAKKNTQNVAREKSPTTAVADRRTTTGAEARIEGAFAAGNYTAVRALAKSNPSESTQKLVGMTKIDMTQVAVGLFAVAVVLTVALFTLH